MYDTIHDWDARERVRERFPRPITHPTKDLLRSVNLLKFYEEATSLSPDNSTFLQHLLCHQDHGQYAFKVVLDSWYHPTKNYMYFITMPSRREEDWPQFLQLPINVAAEMQLIYFQRYVSHAIVQPTNCQVIGGQLHIDSFSREAVRCLSFIVMTLAHYTSNR